MMRFRINWPYAIFCLIAAGAALGFIGYTITNQVYKQWEKGIPISGGFSWPVVFIIDAICLLAFLACLWKLYCDAKTEFGDDAVGRLTVSGFQRIFWSEVTDCKMFNGVGLHIWGGRRKIVISPYAYSRPNDVTTFVLQKIEQRSNMPISYDA